MDSTAVFDGNSVGSDISLDSELREQGRALLQQGRFEEAAERLQKAVGVNPSDESAWRLLGGALASKGEYAGSIPAFEKAVFLAPTNARNFYNLGVALQSVGRDSEARAALETSIRIDPSYRQARAQIDSLNRFSQPSQTETAAIPEAPSRPAVGSIAEIGTVGFSAGRPADSALAAEPARPTGLAPLNAHSGGMPGLSSLGGNAGPEIEAVPMMPPPSSGAPLLRQPPVASQSALGYSPQTPYGGSTSSFTPNPALGMGMGYSQNSSGMQGDVPLEIAGGFNLGAAIISFWWLRNHGLRPISYGLAGLYFVIRMMNTIAHSAFTPFLLLFIQTAVFLALGFMGNSLAWKNRRFDDVEDFKACQRIWMYWAIPVACLQVGLFIFVLAMASTVGSTGALSIPQR